MKAILSPCTLGMHDSLLQGCCCSKPLNKHDFMPFFHLHWVLALAELHAVSVLHSSGAILEPQHWRSNSSMDAACLELQWFEAWETMLSGSHQGRRHTSFWFNGKMALKAGSGETSCECVFTNLVSDLFWFSLNGLPFVPSNQPHVETWTECRHWSNTIWLQ